jgi:predicted enzyme related to lactoylglutathione lyase
MRVTLKNIDLSVADVARSMRFYGEVMGMADMPQSAPPHMMILQAGGVTLSLHQTGTQGGKPVQPGSTELGFECDDLEAMRGRMLEAGARCEPVREYGFGSSFDATDPDGYRLSVYKLRS